MPPVRPLASAMPLQLADMEIRTIFDTAFAGEFLLTPVLHSHPFYELLCVIEGEFFVGFSDGSALPMRAHALCVLPPGLYHRTYTDSPPVRKLAVQFDYRRTHPMEKSVYESFREALSAITEPVLLDGTEVCALMEKIRAELQCGAVASEEMHRALMRELYITVLRLLRSEGMGASASDAADGRNRRYIQIEQFLALQHNQPVTTDDLAAELGLSRRQTDRIFAEIYGMTFREKLVELRMTLAAHLLATTDLPVETVAEQVGYRSLSGFFIAFRRRYGVGASEYRRKFAETFETEISFL
ncbi:MAG: helix-turn-helix domain-containing protein [Clostridia bacterium]|nr:helix-turn-helix domain-containing protein [Clostridia bacterium]